FDNRLRGHLDGLDNQSCCCRGRAAFVPLIMLESERSEFLAWAARYSTVPVQFWPLSARPARFRKFPRSPLRGSSTTSNEPLRRYPSTSATSFARRESGPRAIYLMRPVCRITSITLDGRKNFGYFRLRK